ncbi:hypothetical protein [Microcoleus sp. AR_TQ3_B6]|uniref:hypothetical protein n=1 Tax=Microcoleus sp. AR_TQ3_B6 TaxID=3055284 RepID=UPI002FD437A9
METHIKSVSIGIVNSSSQSTVNSQHHSGVTGNDITSSTSSVITLIFCHWLNLRAESLG